MRARPADSPSERAVGVVVVHEWGFPHRDRSHLLEQARSRGWRVVDDCAHAFAYGLELARSGATVAFSLPKFFDRSSGGLLANPPDVPNAATPLHWTKSESAREMVAAILRTVPSRAAAHVANWRRLDALASARGLSALDILQDGVIPEVYRLRVKHQLAAQAAFEREGVETAPPFYAGWVALPCHADLPDRYWEAVRRAFESLLGED
jgi:hypothetical protein